MKKYWCVNKKEFDGNGKKITVYSVEAEEKPKNGERENMLCVEYHYYFETQEEARAFAKEEEATPAVEEAAEEEAAPEETPQEKADRENWQHCKRIAEELEAYEEGRAYKCPECGAVIEWDALEATEHEDGESWTAYSCPECEHEAREEDFEQLSLYDFFTDVYDIEYRCDSEREYRSVKIMVACGGPNIYIDTARRAVLLYWWTDRAEYPLLSSTCEAVDEWAEEYWNCL